jgi:thioredoxin reductase (NADPH)
VYAASEGLDVLVLEMNVLGGQAGASSKIENYLGFPTGISGQELATRAYVQAQKFGAEVVIARGATKLACGKKPYEVVLDDGLRIPARTAIIATGAIYRKLPLPNLSRFEGAGVYYSATFIERQLCEGEEVIVVGGGNSAGQAAVYLAQKVRRVHILVRSDQLSESMSRYLIRRIENTPNITVHYRTEIVALEGGERLERVRWRNNATGAEEEHAIGHVFVMTGAVPNTQWLQGCVSTDDKGFVKTGSDLHAAERAEWGWPLVRDPYHFETSRPGVFAVGDVRANNIKRVASAVGEGSISIALVHKVLQE